MSFTYAKNVSVFKTTELTEIKHVVADVTLNVCITKHTQKVLNISVVSLLSIKGNSLFQCKCHSKYQGEQLQQPWGLISQYFVSIIYSHNPKCLIKPSPFLSHGHFW